MAFKFTIDEGIVVEFGPPLTSGRRAAKVIKYTDEWDYVAKEVLPKLEGYENDTSTFACVKILEGGGYDSNIYKNQACHARMGTDSNIGSALIVSTVREHTTPHGKAFFKWLINSSPWAAIFSEKKVNTTVVPHLRLHTYFPSNFIVSGLIASRSPWEFPDKAKHWHELVKAGMNPNLAYLTCTATRKEGKGFSLMSTVSSHWAITTNMSLKAMKKFVSGSPDSNCLKTGTFRDNPRYSGGIFGLFGTEEKYGTGSSFFQSLADSKVKKKSGWDGRVTSVAALSSLSEMIKKVNEKFYA